MIDQLIAEQHDTERARYWAQFCPECEGEKDRDEDMCPRCLGFYEKQEAQRAGRSQESE